MGKAPTVEQALRAAVVRLLRPLVRLLLRYSVPFSVFEELAKRAYVDVAMQDFEVPGKKSTISRASVLTGLTRQEWLGFGGCVAAASVVYLVARARR